MWATTPVTTPDVLLSRNAAGFPSLLSRSRSARIMARKTPQAPEGEMTTPHYGSTEPRGNGLRKSDSTCTILNRPPAKALHLRRRERKPRLLSPAQVLKVLDLVADKPQLMAMTLLGVNCGMGNTDCSELEEKDLDLKSGTRRQSRRVAINCQSGRPLRVTTHQPDRRWQRAVAGIATAGGVQLRSHWVLGVARVLPGMSGVSVRNSRPRSNPTLGDAFDESSCTAQFPVVVSRACVFATIRNPPQPCRITTKERGWMVRGLVSMSPSW